MVLPKSLIALVLLAASPVCAQPPPPPVDMPIPVERATFLGQSTRAPLTRLARPRTREAQIAAVNEELKGFDREPKLKALGEALTAALGGGDATSIATARTDYEHARSAWALARISQCRSDAANVASPRGNRIAPACESAETYEVYRNAQLALDAASTDDELRTATQAVDMAVVDNARAQSDFWRALFPEYGGHLPF